MSDQAAIYERFRWLVDEQLLEPEVIDELNEIEQITKAISEISEEPAELYTTS